MIDYNALYAHTQSLSLLFAEDFEPLRLEMTSLLEDLFLRVVSVSDGEKAWKCYQEEEFDIVMSDIHMPHTDGITLSKKIREISKDQSIIILSARSDKEHLLSLINIGISKFITKPIQHKELFSVLYEESEKCTAQKVVDLSKDVLLSEGFVWHCKTLVLTNDEKEVELTKYELLLLQLFISKNGCTCGNEDILDYFQLQDINMLEKNIRNLVFKLRQKLPEKCVSNVYGIGYRFTSLS